MSTVQFGWEVSVLAQVKLCASSLEKNKQEQQMCCLEVDDVLRQCQTQQGVWMKYMQRGGGFVVMYCGPDAFRIHFWSNLFSAA